MRTPRSSNARGKWLKQEDSIFHLIVDELHLYRGTSGTEVAYLLRLLLDRLGLEPGHPKLKVLASSASLEPDDADSLRFLSEFFGTTWHANQIIPGYPDPLPAPVGAALDPAPFAALSVALDAGDQATIDSASLDVVAALGHAGNGESADRQLAQSLAASAGDLAPRMIGACVASFRDDEDPSLRAVPFSTFAANVFDHDPSATQAARGLLYARGVCDAAGVPTALPSFRLHWFFRNVEGMWACTSASCSGRAGAGDARTAGPLYLDSHILCEGQEERHRVLELLYCEQCGTTFFGGSRLVIPHGGGMELLTADPDIEGIPDRQAARFVERRTWGDFAVFWPSGARSLHSDAARTWKQPSLSAGAPGIDARWTPASLDPSSGRVQLGAASDGTVPGYLFDLTGNFDPDMVGALPAVCPDCGKDYGRRLFRKSPSRGFRTGFSKLTQLLSKELFYLIPGPPDASAKTRALLRQPRGSSIARKRG